MAVPEEYDVDIVFAGAEFTLVVTWTTDDATDDATRVGACSAWFGETYGMDLSACTVVRIDRVADDAVSGPD